MQLVGAKETLTLSDTKITRVNEILQIVSPLSENDCESVRRSVKSQLLAYYSRQELHSAQQFFNEQLHSRSPGRLLIIWRGITIGLAINTGASFIAASNRSSLVSIVWSFLIVFTCLIIDSYMEQAIISIKKQLRTALSLIEEILREKTVFPSFITETEEMNN